MAKPRIDFTRFFTYDQLRRSLAALARWKPELAALHKIGKSPAGRDVLLIEINNPKTGPAEDKPAYLVHGNIHASEVSGATSALYLAHYLLANAEADEETARLLERVAFYICPRITVDGAEEALVLGRVVRSRQDIEERKNHLTPQDINGDGRILQMRVPDPDGNQIAFDDDPRVMFQRTPNDKGGKRFRMVVEGLIHDWDRGPWSDAAFTHLDFNRNWGVNWKPPHQQGGAGRYSFSEPETRALADFVYDHENIFGMLGFHTGPNAVLRPPSTGGEDSIQRADLAVFRELATLGAGITRFPAKAVHEYHNVFQQPIELRGHFPDWGYNALGLFVFEIELGILWNSIGYSTDQIFKFTEPDRREVARKMMAWHDERPEQGAFVEWAPFNHPQLGPVEIGGWTPVGRGNVAPQDRVGVWDRSRRFIYELASRGPKLRIRDVEVKAIGRRVFKVTCRVVNDGAQPTSVTQYGAAVQGVDGAIVEVERKPTIEFLAGRNYTRLGHIAAYGYKELTWLLRAPAKGPASITISAHAARAGRATTRVKLR